MQRISTEVDGIFKNGVRGVQRGTRFNAEWCNAVQEELCNFIVSAGLSLDANDSGQLWKALLAVFAAGISIGNSTVVGGSGSSSQARLKHTGLGVFADGVNVELGAENIELVRGQKSAHIGSKIESNNIVVTVDEIVELAKNLIVKGFLKVEGNAQFDGGVGVTGALNVGGAIAAAGGFIGGASGGSGTQANYPQMRTDVLRARTSGGKVSVPDGASGAFEGVFSGVWIPGENNYFSRTSETIFPIEEMADLPDGAVAVFYGHSSEANYIISWRDMNYTVKTKTVPSGTPFVFMKKKNSQNQDCGHLLSVGEA